MEYRHVTTLRSLFGGATIGLLIAGMEVASLLGSLGFLSLHWWAHFLGQRYKVDRGEYRFSSIVSSGVAWVVFGILIFRERIPIVLASVFVAVSVIKVIFMMQSTEYGKGKFRPMGTYWSLSASMFFLMCYYSEPSLGMVIASVLFLSYLLFATGAFTRKVMVLKVASRQRSLAQRR